MKSQLMPSFFLAGAVILISQPVFAQAIQVTQVKLNPTEKGIEVILETPVGEQLQVLPRTDGNTYIADIPNAQLRLLSGNSFRQDNPVAGITAVTVRQALNSIQVTVTGASSVPAVELFDSDQGLIFGVKSDAFSTEANESPQTPATPQQVEPGRETQPDAMSPEDEAIEIVVTGEQETGYSVPDAQLQPELTLQSVTFPNRFR